MTIENQNFLSPLNFRFQLKRAPHVNFFVQNVNLPGIALPQVDVGNPNVKVPFPGDHLSYEELSVTFRVDEDLQNYMEIHSWIKSLGRIKYSDYKRLDTATKGSGEGLRSDISVSILTSKQNPNYEVVYKECIPISLSSIDFTTMDQEVLYVEARASFAYVYYDISKI